MLSNLHRIQSYEWSRFVTWSVSRCTAFVSIYIRNLIRHMATFISTRRNNLSNGLIRPIRLSESTRYIRITDLNYWIKLLSCIIEANGGHIGLSHINLHWYYWGSRRGFYRFRLLVGMDKHCVNEISFTNNFCFFLNLPMNNELGIVQDGRHEFIIKCFKPSQNH